MNENLTVPFLELMNEIRLVGEPLEFPVTNEEVSRKMEFKKNAST